MNSFKLVAIFLLILSSKSYGALENPGLPKLIAMCEIAERFGDALEKPVFVPIIKQNQVILKLDEKSHFEYSDEDAFRVKRRARITKLISDGKKILNAQVAVGAKQVSFIDVLSIDEKSSPHLGGHEIAITCKKGRSVVILPK